MTPRHHIIKALMAALHSDLPGWDAQRKLMPEGRLDLPRNDHLKAAAVLIALFPKDDSWYFPLIRRSHDGFAHSGQIALPGGRHEGEESLVNTAIREAWEEVNIQQDRVTVLGELSPLPIPVSQHLVHPIVAILDEAPDLKPDPREVDEIFVVTLEQLLSTPIQVETRTLRGRKWEIPFFSIQGQKVWGATSMILSEFKSVLENLDLAD